MSGSQTFLHPPTFIWVFKSSMEAQMASTYTLLPSAGTSVADMSFASSQFASLPTFLGNIFNQLRSTLS